MWPKYLDIDNQACAGILRKLELEAYSSVISALRAQGELSKERRKVMNDLSNVLNIPIERHKAEIRRAVNDELLNTVAASVCGNGNNEVEWAKEGRRIIPLLKRATPITAFTPLANEGSDHLNTLNKNLPSPLNTKSDSKRKSYSPSYALKYSKRTPPKDLSEMVTRVKDEDSDSVHALIRTPPIAMPSATPSNQEVVVLPSGKAIRLHTDKLNEINEALDSLTNKKQKRKRKLSTPDLTSKPAFEVLSKAALMNMMPPPPIPTKMGLLGQTLRGTSSNRRGSRGGGRRPKSVPRLPPPPVQPVQPPQPPQQPQMNLQMLAEAINHQQEQEREKSTEKSETPQVAITPPKVVVVTTPSGGILRTSTTTSTSTSTSTESSKTVKLKVGDSPMKVYPVGARILPKSTVTTSSGSGNQPVFMVATSPNLIRGKQAQTVTLTTGQRVVTVNTGNLRPQVQGAKINSGTIKTLQPRVVTTVSGITGLKTVPSVVTNSSKPSVIVVQRSGSGLNSAAIGTAKTIVTKDTLPAGGQRILGTKPASTTTKQPIVIVSKGSSNIITSSTETNSTSNTNQNVIVLDLSHDNSSTTTSTTTTTATNSGKIGNNVLSDILQMTGIMSPEDPEMPETNSLTEKPSSNTTTLQKVPGDSSSWIVLESNGSKDENSKAENSKMDIFSQAMASAEIGDFSVETNSIEIGNDDDADKNDPEPPLVSPAKSNAANILFASPHDVMPTSQKLDDEIFTTENHHENSVIVEEVGDEIEAEVVSMKDDFGP